MRSDFTIAITQLAAEKNLPKETVISAVEAALASVYKKKDFAANQNISVRINPNNGEVKVYVQKTVVETLTDPRREILLTEAQNLKKDATLDETIEIEATPHNAGRIAAQTAKQVILQRLHEAEHAAIYEEYFAKEGDIVTGIVQRIEPKQIFIDLGRTMAVLPASEQVRNERLRVGQRLKLLLLEVARTPKGPQVLVSRSHRNLLRRLLELEIPEIHSGNVELKLIAREAGYRSKVAAASRQAGIDAVGCCVGLRGIRIQNVVNELYGERIDVVQWHPNPAIFIANALSPAQTLAVELNEEEGAATVVVPDKQLSLAIGKEGQNARLAAKLTGWRIDIKSASVAEAEKAAREKEEVTAAPTIELPAEEGEEKVTAMLELESELPARAEVVEALPSETETEAEAEIEVEPLSEAISVLEIPPEFRPALESAKLRFAEDLQIREYPPDSKAKGGKKKGTGKRAGEPLATEGTKIRKARRLHEVSLEDEDYYDEHQ